MKYIFKLIFLFIDKLEGKNYCIVRNIINLIFKREYKLNYDKFNQIYKKYIKMGSIFIIQIRKER